MERRGGGEGRPWRSRGAARGLRPSSSSFSSSSSSSSYRERWRPSPSRSTSSTHSPSESKGDRNLVSDESTAQEREKPVVDEDTPPLVGTCPDMCPAKERTQREQLRDLAVFERLDGNPGRTSPTLAVKKFCRTMSTMHMKALDIRPLPVLQKTLGYLLDLVDSSDHPFEVIHDFVFDRTRSIRQDLSVQKIVNNEVIHMYEEMVKFHIISDHRLRRCCGKLDISSLLHLNMEQLIKSLTSLYDLYAINRSSDNRNYNEAEFYSFYVLLQLGCKSQEGDSISLWLRKMEASILRSKEMNFVRGVLRCFRMGNYRCFFKIIASESSYLQFCLLEPVIEEVRARALSYIICSGYKLHPYPLAHLSHVLTMKESDLEALCHACGLETSTDETGCLFLPARQMGFHMPEVLQSYSFVDSESQQRWESRDGRLKHPGYRPFNH